MLRLYDTLSRTVKPVNSTINGKVKIYTCGPTVYRESHLGNLRSYLMADWIKRILINSGSHVLHIKNIWHLFFIYSVSFLLISYRRCR